MKEIKNLKNNLVIYFTLVVISFSIERYFISCNHSSPYTLSISFIHHMFAVYLYFGSFIFGFYLFNIVVGLLTLFGWYLFGNRCFLSIYYNKICNIDEKVQFHDIINLINKFLQVPNLHYYILGIIFIYNLYHLCDYKKI